MKQLLILILLTPCLHAFSQNASISIYKADNKEAAYPRLSKDNNSILFQTNTTGHWQLAILDIATNQISHLTTDSFNNNFPDWSPDNQLLAFCSDRDGNEEIYLMHKDGKGLKRLTNDQSRDIHPYFSTDGRFLLFNSTRGNGSFDIYQYDLHTGTISRLTDTPQNETCARYSPDMQSIVFLKNDHAGDDIFLMDLMTRSITNITNTPPVRDGWPMFSHDGQWIYFSSHQSGVFCIYRIQKDGSLLEKLSNPGPAEEDARVYVAHDGKSFIFNRRSGNTLEIRQASI